MKLIVTDNAEVTSNVTKAANRQTEVKKEAFASMLPFQKELEEFYLTFGKAQSFRLFYERRSKQFAEDKIDRVQIVTLSAQLKAYIAMFLNEPHSTHRYYGELLTANRNRIFQPNHSLYPYYL